MIYTVTYTVKNDEQSVDCGTTARKAKEVFRKVNRKSRETILWRQKPRKVKQQTGKHKTAQSFGKREMIVISHIGTLTAVAEKQIPEMEIAEFQAETPKPTRKKDKPIEELSVMEIIESLSGPTGKKMLVSEMNAGDIFIRWDGEEFVRIGRNRIENTATGITESCESDCSGIVTGNRFGENQKSINQETRTYAKPKVDKRKAKSAGEEKKRIHTCAKEFIEVKIHGLGWTRIVEAKIEDCFRRNDGNKVVWDSVERTQPVEKATYTIESILTELGIEI